MSKSGRNLFLPLLLLPSLLLASDLLPVEVINRGNQPLFQQIASYTVFSALGHSPKVMEIKDGKMEEVATQYDKENGVLLFLLSGSTKPGETRQFQIDLGGKSQATSDLKLVETRETIRISNTYFQVEHPKKGAGGFPSSVVFNISGNRERFVFEDRLYEKDLGYFTLRGDNDSSARVISQGPLEIVVEANARYFSNHYAPGNARATYIYKYHAYSPYIEVSAKVEKDDDFLWSELHFLQISRKDNTFLFWAGGDPLQQGKFSDSRQGKTLEKWAIMFNYEDAIGLYTEGDISLFDGISEYYNYIQEAISSFGERARYLNAWLYLGPPPSDLARTFAEIKKEVKMEIHPLPLSSFHLPEHKIENGILQIGLASEEDGLGVVSILNKSTGEDLLQVPLGETPLIWRLILSRGGEDNLTIDNTIPSQRDIQAKRTKSGLEYQLNWHNIDIGEEKDILDVSVKIELPDGSSLSSWWISVDNRSKVYGLWEVHFPLLFPLGKAKEVDVAVPRSNWGYLYRQLGESISGYYPSCDWPMQFISLNKNDSGLYLACHDPDAWTKSFSYKPGSAFYFDVRVENMGIAGSDFHSFPFAIGVYEGNWLRACKIYREWALKNAPWTRKGPLTKRKDTPEIIKNLGLWIQGGGTREEVVPSMLKAQEFFQVPLGIHWYNWHQIGFDTEYPNYFPYKPGFPQGVKELTSRGIIAMPYINGRLWDSSLASFKNEAIVWCAKQLNGEPYIEVYNPQVKHAVMCPYSKFWQDKINEIVERLIKECGVNAIYIDQIGAAGSVLCFDKNHGHPLGGGGYWVSGYRELLRRVKEKASGKVAITTENNAEPYMDGVDAFLIWNPRHPDEIPMMTAVYSGYTIYFSSPTHGYSDTISFTMLEGRDFIWGCQLGWMGFELLSPEHKDKAEFLKTLAKYRVASLKYIVYGELLGEIAPLSSPSEVKGTWFQWNGGTFTVELPAVMGTYWRGSDNTIGAIIVNVSDKEELFSFPFPGELLPRGKNVLISDISPQGKQPLLHSGSTPLTLSLPPFSVRILEFQPVESKQSGKLPPAYEYAMANGLEWDLSTDKIEVTEGEKYAVLFRAKANKPLKLILDLEEESFPLNLDGKKTSQLVIPKFVPLSSDEQTICLKGTLHFGGYKTEVAVPIKVLPKFHISLSAGTLRAGEKSLLKVSLRNNSSRPRSARLFLRFPPQWEAEPADTLQVEVPPLEESNFLFQVYIPPQFSPGEVRIKAYIGEQSAILTGKVLPPSPLAECPYFKPQDATLLAMKEHNPLRIEENGVKIPDWRGEEDISGRVWVGWDEENFYLLAEVKDDYFHQPFSGKDIWQGDCIQLAFRPAEVANYSTYEGVYEFGVALATKGKEVYQWTPREGNLDSASCEITQEEGSLIYQLSLPWKTIGLDGPKVGRELGWAFTINENDGEGFRGWLEWAGGICGGKDASLFGKLLLKNGEENSV